MAGPSGTPLGGGEASQGRLRDVGHKWADAQHDEEPRPAQGGPAHRLDLAARLNSR